MVESFAAQMCQSIQSKEIIYLVKRFEMNQIAFFEIFLVILLSFQVNAETNCLAAANAAESILVTFLK